MHRQSRRLRVSLFCLVASSLWALPAERAAAQGGELGVHASYSNITGGTWGLCARGAYNLPAGDSLFQIQGTGDLYFPDCSGIGSCDLWDFQINAVFFLTRQRQYEPYLGGGVSFQGASLTGAIVADDTFIGPVAFIGTTLGFWGRAEPFVEGKWLFKSGDAMPTQFVLQFGMVFELGRPTDAY